MLIRKRYKYVDTRQYMRLAAPHMIRYKLLEDFPKKTIGEDAAGAGIIFMSNEKLPRYGIIEMEISAPAIPRPIRAMAKVIKTEPADLPNTYKISVQFVGIKDRDRETLGKLTEVDIYDTAKFIELSPPHFSVKHTKLEEKEPSTSVTKDISAGGVSFATNEEISVSSLIELEINFPATPHPIKATAKVVRVEPLKKEGTYRIGAQFLGIDEKDKLAIDNFIMEIMEVKRGRKWWWRKI